MTNKLESIQLNLQSSMILSPEMESERISAITELLTENSFAPEGLDRGPYNLIISLIEGRFNFQIDSKDKDKSVEINMPVQGIKPLLRDYGMVCESYYEAIKAGNCSRIEAIDMGRRGLHNEAADRLIDLLWGKVNIDFQTARRLFTLLFVAHTKSVMNHR